LHIKQKFKTNHELLCKLIILLKNKLEFIKQKFKIKKKNKFKKYINQIIK